IFLRSSAGVLISRRLTIHGILDFTGVLDWSEISTSLASRNRTALLNHVYIHALSHGVLLLLAAAWLSCFWSHFGVPGYLPADSRKIASRTPHPVLYRAFAPGSGVRVLFSYWLIPGGEEIDFLIGPGAPTLPSTVFDLCAPLQCIAISDPLTWR
ncbi:hypothetical protein KQX54_012411, partial [Cotesia glomerata]